MDSNPPERASPGIEWTLEGVKCMVKDVISAFVDAEEGTLAVKVIDRVEQETGLPRNDLVCTFLLLKEKGIFELRDPDNLLSGFRVTEHGTEILEHFDEFFEDEYSD